MATAKLAYMYICFELLILHVERKNAYLQVPINKLFTHKKSINKFQNVQVPSLSFSFRMFVNENLKSRARAEFYQVQVQLV